MRSPDQHIRVHAYYSGRVQGVGFRARTVSIARSFTVSGQVRNLDDGRVELIAEGPEEDVLKFLRELSRQMGPFIRDVQQTQGPATGEWNELVVGY